MRWEIIRGSGAFEEVEGLRAHAARRVLQRPAVPVIPITSQTVIFRAADQVNTGATGRRR